MPSQFVAKSLAAASIDEARSMDAFADPPLEAVRLEKVLRPATPGEISEAVRWLFKVRPMQNLGETEREKEENAKANLATYLAALQGYPRWAIIEARTAFLNGLIEGANDRFAPNSAELGRECARRVAGHREKLVRMRRQAEERMSLEDGAAEPLSESARELGRRRIAELRAHAAEERRTRATGGRDARPVIAPYVDETPITLEALQAAGIPDARPRADALRKTPSLDAIMRSPPERQ